MNVSRDRLGDLIEDQVLTGRNPAGDRRLMAALTAGDPDVWDHLRKRVDLVNETVTLLASQIQVLHELLEDA